jgi:late competence protein required for DNA uptake (superfamily II DNA/RNA helicase)
MKEKKIKCNKCGDEIKGWAYTDLETGLTYCSDCYNLNKESPKE